MADSSTKGTLLSSGTEDYFDSAWYFNAGNFRFPVSGFTYLNQTSANSLSVRVIPGSRNDACSGPPTASTKWTRCDSTTVSSLCGGTETFSVGLTSVLLLDYTNQTRRALSA